jgi:hypothetical protein
MQIIRRKEGVAVRELSAEVGLGPGEVVRIARTLGERALLLPVGDRAYVKPGRRARINDKIASMIRSGERAGKPARIRGRKAKQARRQEAALAQQRQEAALAQRHAQ